MPLSFSDLMDLRSRMYTQKNAAQFSKSSRQTPALRASTNLCDDTPHGSGESGIIMDDSEKRYQFREADELYRHRRYQEALAILVELDRNEPDVRHILFPIARCLSRLEQYDEALKLTHKIFTEYEYEPAQLLHDKIKRRIASGQKIDMTSFEVDLNAPPQFSGDSTSIQSRDASTSSTAFNVKLAAGVIGVLVIAVLCRKTIMVEFWEWFDIRGTQPEAPVPLLPMLTVAAEFLFLGFAGICVGLYIGFIAGHALPFSTFQENLRDIARFAPIALVLVLIPVVGWVALPVMLYRQYNLGFGSLFVVCLVSTTFAGATFLSIIRVVDVLAGVA